MEDEDVLEFSDQKEAEIVQFIKSIISQVVKSDLGKDLES